MTWRLVVHVDPYRTSRNQLDGHHWQAGARLKKQARDEAVLAWWIAGRPRAPGRVRVSVIVRRARAIDPANVWDGLKPVIDGLFCARRNGGAGITPDDSARYLELGSVAQETGREYRGDPHVELHVETLEPEVA